MNTHKSLRTAVAVAVFMVVMAGLGASAASAQTPEGDDRAAALRILELVNRDRAQAGLAPLADRADVTAVAASWSASMAQARQLSHSDDYFSAESRQRLGAKALGENVARAGSPDEAHKRLMASPGHHANIVSTTFTVVGIAVFRDSGGSYWVTQDFLTPKTAAAPAAAAAPAPQPAPAPAPRSAAVTPVAAPAPPPAPRAATPTADPQPEPAGQATVDTALISAELSAGSRGWNGRPPARVAAAGTRPLASPDHMVLAAACANALVALFLVTARRRRQGV